MRSQHAFGKVLRKLRNECGFSQDRLAHDADLDRTYVSMLERGIRQPTLDTMVRLSRALGVTLSELARMIEEALQR
jgi:transcriptional regulator with XRE-family HTH domain